MSKEAKTGNDVTESTSNAGKTSSEINQKQVDLISRGVKAFLDVFEPLKSVH